MTTLPRAILLAVGALALTSSLVPSVQATEQGPVKGAPRTVLDVRDLDLGEPPAVAWSRRAAGKTVIHGPDGAEASVPYAVAALAPMGSGYVVQTPLSRGVATYWVGADGTLGRHEWRTGDGLAVSPLGNVVAFAGRRGKVWTIDREGDRVFRFNPVPVAGTAHAVTVAGENCKEGEGDTGHGCSIVVNGPRRAFYTSSHGIVETVPRLRQATTGRGRWLGGTTSSSDTGSCSAMLRSWRVAWRTCDNQLSDIAPDNRHVLGTPAYADGFGPTALDVLTTTDGSTVHAFTSARNGRSATYFDEVWEDAEHVLVVTYQDGEWAVVRLGVDGSMEYAVAPVRRSMDTGFPFHLQTR